MKLPRNKRKNLIEICRAYREMPLDKKKFFVDIFVFYIKDLRNRGYKEAKKYLRYLR